MVTLATWLALERFEYRPLDHSQALVRLQMMLEQGRQAPRAPRLIVSDRKLCRRFPAADVASEALGLWVASFDIPLEVVEYPTAAFRFAFSEQVVFALPRPTLALDPAPRRMARGRAAAFAAGLGLAVAGSPFTGVAFASAGKPPHMHVHKHPLKTQTPAPKPAAVPVAHPPHASAWNNCPGARHHLNAKSLAEQLLTLHPGSNCTAPLKAPQHHPGTRAPKHHAAKAHHPHRLVLELHTGGAGLAPKRPTQPPAVHRAKPPAPHRAAPPVAQPAPPPLDPFTAAEVARFRTVTAKNDRPPAYLIPIYKAAGHRYHVPWQILAAINAIETNFGNDLRVSPAGAIGWMQFMPATWIAYAIDADGRGRPNPYDPRDAIFTAARYLAAHGAPENMRRALFAYNHALWYVDAVLWRAQTITDRALRGSRGKAGYALPLDARFMRVLGRTDDGVDIETAPDGAAVYSMTSGVVTAIASDPGGFGPNYPVVLVTQGPLAGQYVYYGHVAASLVRVGQHVSAGQPIAVMGHTGDAAGLGHGHIEIGFSDASGDPLNHHGSDAWTPSGDAMRRLIVSLSAAFGIRNS